MTVVSVDKDPEQLSVTVTAQFDAPVEAVWELWADPRRLERWWGPAEYPATFTHHDLSAGGRCTFYMTSPEGERHGGWWQVVAVDPPRSLDLLDGWADPEGNPTEGTPVTTIRVELAEHDGGTRMVVRSTFESEEHLRQVEDMGALEAFASTVGQMDALLAAGA
jgi:uncharacterized protein YndB with AHSA1/START domain